MAEGNIGTYGFTLATLRLGLCWNIEAYADTLRTHERPWKTTDPSLVKEGTKYNL